MYANQMGRPKTVFLDLPPRMTARKLKRGTVRYYYTGGGKKIPLGSDINKARLEWAKLENGGATASGESFAAVSERWEREAIKVGRGGRIRAARTQYGYGKALKNLRAAFKDFLLNEIRPKHIREYLDLRSAKVAANREKSLFSVIFSWARGKGITDAPNPCIGIENNAEQSRERYVSEEEYRAVWEKSEPAMQDAMDLAYLTGQRPGDVLKMMRQDIREGCLWVKQGKTGVRMGIRLEGELGSVVERILARSGGVQSIFLVSTPNGQPIRYRTFHRRFVAALKASGVAPWQFRDLRAKAATDAGDLKHAQRLLGHTNEHTTAAVYRRIKGTVVGPLR